MPRERVGDVDINYLDVGDGPPLLMLHGFTGSIDAWQGLPEWLGQHFRVIAVDMIGHGASDSPDNPERYRIERAVEDLLRLLEHLGIERATVLGYSMGGRVALHLALAAPERVSRLILESSAPGIDDPEERQARRDSDERLALMIEGEGLEAFVDHWESIPLFASQHSLPDDVRARQREIRLGQNPAGLANSLRGMGAGAMEPVTNQLGEFSVPVLYIAGELDEKYRDVGRHITAKMPCARYFEIPNAGHTVHLEQPETWSHTVLEFAAEAQEDM